MLENIKSLLGLDEIKHQHHPRAVDKNLAAAALMVHVIVADGKITKEEEARLHAVLLEHYSVSEADALDLTKAAREAQSDAVDLYRFTSILKDQMEEEERLARHQVFD